MRYILFGSDEVYYANGGAHDFLGCGNSVDDLVNSEVLKVSFERDGDNAIVIEWWHIFDTETREIVAGSEQQAHGAGDLDKNLIYP
jgi:hypothetical protein